MSYSKIWAPHEDDALLHIYRDLNICKWTEISHLLAKEFNIFNKSPKKCRQRFNNHLNPIINRQQWTEIEEKTLIDLQREIGNRWAEIARNIVGRTDNSVKNKFYSLFRKPVRQINQLAAKKIKSKTTLVTMAFLYKLIAVVDKKFSPNCSISKELLFRAEQLKNNIIKYEYGVGENCKNEEKLQKIIEDVHWINFNFKRKVLTKKTNSAPKDLKKSSLKLPPTNQEDSIGKDNQIIHQKQEIKIQSIEDIGQSEQAEIFMKGWTLQRQPQQIDCPKYCIEMKSIYSHQLHDFV